MLYWALAFFTLAFIAAFLGFGAVAGSVAGIAEIFFYGFLALAIIVLVTNFTRRRV